MDAKVFWDVIGNYNEKTWIIQIILLVFVLLAGILSYMQKVKWAVKFALGFINLYKTEPIQKYFALPLYLVCGDCLYTKAGIAKMM